MKKVYLLLRNNLQTGPYTIEELLQQQLKPSDLVWAEGKSLAWTYPVEMAELNPWVEWQSDFREAKNQSTTESSSAIDDEIEKKAEELRQRALSFTPTQIILIKNQSPTGDYNHSSYKPELAIKFIDHRKEKNNTTVEYFTAAIITIFIGASLYGGSLYFNRRPVNVNPASTQIVTTDENSAKKGNKSKSFDYSINYQNNSNNDSVLLADIKPRLLTVKKKNKARVRIAPVKLETQTIPVKSEDELTTPPIQKAIEVQETKEPIVPENATEQFEKKKTLGQAIKGLFKKKKKVEE